MERTIADITFLAPKLTTSAEQELWDNWLAIASALLRNYKGHKLVWQSYLNQPYSLTRYIAYGVCEKKKIIYWQCLPIKDALSLDKVVLERLDELESWADCVWWFGPITKDNNIFDLANGVSVKPTLKTSIGGKELGTGPLLAAMTMGLETGKLEIELPYSARKITA